jgi:hypothetical protein
MLLMNALGRFGGGSLVEEGGPWLREKNVMGSLRELVEILAKVPGRKALILVSLNIPGDAYRIMEYRPGPFSAAFSDVNPDFQRAISAATRGNVAIYPVDPRGLTTELPAPGSFDTSLVDDRNNLTALAEVTGGFALTNSNRYEAAFDRLVREHSTYYLLGFNSAVERRDGRFVPIRVRVRRSGLQVQTLNGYVTTRQRAPETRTPGSVLAAVWDAVSSPLTTSGVPMRVYAAPFRGPRKEATVALALEIAASKLNLVERDGAFRGELEVVLAATDAKRKRHPIYRHRWAIALKPETYQRVSRSAFRVLTQMPLPEGRYQLRVSAGGAALAGSVVYDLVVPDFQDDFSLSGIAVTSARAAEAFTVSPHKQLDVAFPAPPTTAREFERSDTVMLFAEAYENRRRPHAVLFTTELRDVQGRVVETTSSRRESPPKPAQAGVYRLSQNLVLEDVPPGRYVVHVEARSTLDGNRALSRDVPIRVR